MAELRQPAPAALAWAAGQIGDGARVLSATGLREGSNPWLLRIGHGDRAVDAVLKTAQRGDPGGFATEIAALRLAEERGIPAPRIIGLDAGGKAAGTRAVLESVVPGRSTIPVEPSPGRLSAMGAATAALHLVPAGPSPALPLRTRPISASDFARDRRLGTEPNTPLLAAADDLVRRLPVPDGRIVFGHGDLWQGNLMWDGDALTGCSTGTWPESGTGT